MHGDTLSGSQEQCYTFSLGLAQNVAECLNCFCVKSSFAHKVYNRLKELFPLKSGQTW